MCMSHIILRKNNEYSANKYDISKHRLQVSRIDVPKQIYKYYSSIQPNKSSTLFRSCSSYSNNPCYDHHAMFLHRNIIIYVKIW